MWTLINSQSAWRAWHVFKRALTGVKQLCATFLCGVFSLFETTCETCKHFFQHCCYFKLHWYLFWSWFCLHRHNCSGTTTKRRHGSISGLNGGCLWFRRSATTKVRGVAIERVDVQRELGVGGAGNGRSRRSRSEIGVQRHFMLCNNILVLHHDTPNVLLFSFNQEALYTLNPKP